MKFILYRWKVFCQEDLIESLEKFGHTVDSYYSLKPEKTMQELEAEDINKGMENFECQQKKKIEELEEAFCDYDAVISFNYFQEVSQACENCNTKYIVWTIDSPMLSMYHQSVFNKCNYLFLFDKFCYLQFKAMGVQNVYYLPLAVNVERVEHTINHMTKQDFEQFSQDISFVGGIYDKNFYDGIVDKLPEYLRGYFDACFQAQLDTFGENMFDRMMTPDILSQLEEIITFKQEEGSLLDIKLSFISTFLGYKMAQIERIESLLRLAKVGRVNWYCDKMYDELPNIYYKGTASYFDEMPKVFAASKINMNFTIKNIRTGLPLRVWDVLGAGGFLLTNFQPELLMYFENEKDLVYYDSLDDMQKKAQYYLTHKEERMEIARNGHEKVKKLHSYDKRVQQILDIVWS